MVPRTERAGGNGTDTARRTRGAGVRGCRRRRPPRSGGRRGRSCSATRACSGWRSPAPARSRAGAGRGAGGPRRGGGRGARGPRRRAYRLRQAGIDADIHEASARVGGRCWTHRDGWADGQIAERGGELIDQGHPQIRHLAHELGLELDNLLAAEANETEPTYWFDGTRYSYGEATRDLKAAWQKIHRDLSEASFPTTYALSTQRGRELDAMSIVDWIEETFPGGVSSKIGQLLTSPTRSSTAPTRATRARSTCSTCSGTPARGTCGSSAARTRSTTCAAATTSITSRLADAVAGRITTGSELVAIRQTAAGRWELTFRQGSASRSFTADRVVLALPFSILRRSVDLRRAGFGALKERAIREQGMGTNSKLHVQFRSRPWRGHGFNGDSYSDRGYQSTWEVTRAQPGASGILVDYTGGAVGAGFGSGTPAARAQQFLAQAEPVLPGLTAAWNGKAAVEFWPG